VYSMIFTR